MAEDVPERTREPQLEDSRLRARQAAGEFARKEAAAESAERGSRVQAELLRRQREAEEQRLRQEDERRAQALRTVSRHTGRSSLLRGQGERASHGAALADKLLKQPEAAAVEANASEWPHVDAVALVVSQAPGVVDEKGRVVGSRQPIGEGAGVCRAASETAGAEALSLGSSRGYGAGGRDAGGHGALRRRWELRAMVCSAWRRRASASRRCRSLVCLQYHSIPAQHRTVKHDIVQEHVP